MRSTGLTAASIWRVWAMLIAASALGAAPARSDDKKIPAGDATPGASITDRRRDDIRHQFIHGAFALRDGAGTVLGRRWIGSAEPPPLDETDVVVALTSRRLSDDEAVALWEMLAGESHASFLTLPLLKAAVGAASTPRAREALWGELVALLERVPQRAHDPGRIVSLIGRLESHRSILLPLLVPVEETVGGGEEMVRLMLASRVFGADLRESLAVVARLSPAALERWLDRERAAGRAVAWEEEAAVLLAPWRAEQQAALLRPAALAQLATEVVRQRFIHGAFALYDATGRKLGERWTGNAEPLPLAERAVVEALSSHRLSPEDAAALWELLAAEQHAPLLTRELLKAAIAATEAPRAREAMWSELSSLATRLSRGESRSARGTTLVGILERHHDEFAPHFTDTRETEGGGDEMVKLMLETRIFGADLRKSLAFVIARNPAAVARKIERERSLSRPVVWERYAFDLLTKWKDERLVPGARGAPASLAALDAAGEQLIAILNNLHGFDDGDRRKILQGLGPAEVFNAIVAGEQELYRLGTSSYHRFLHPIVLTGLKQSASFEAFLERTTVKRFGEEAMRASARRGMVFLRVASSFGLIDPVIESVRDRSRFIDDVIASLGDPATFEANSSVLIEVLNAPSRSRALAEFKRDLLARLYERYRSEQGVLRSVYGSMLSVYQTVTGDHRDRSIDRAYPLDPSIFNVPFERLFTINPRGTYVHRMFMRMDKDADAQSSLAGFRVLMQRLGAVRREVRTFDVFTIPARGRMIEIYVNNPTDEGNKRGITDLAAALEGRRIETVIGRGHTHIIAPLQTDSKRIAGERIGDVALVLVGACGGDASVRELIATFGYKPFLATKATGRAVINNAIINAYVAALRSMRPGQRLSVPDVLRRAVGPLLRQRSDDDLRTDANHYEANMTTVYTTYLFDTHVRRHIEFQRYSSR